jgi:hypothetical protein
VNCDLADLATRPPDTSLRQWLCTFLAEHQHSLVQPHDVWHRQPRGQAFVLTAVGNRMPHLSTASVATAAGLAARTL